MARLDHITGEVAGELDWQGNYCLKAQVRRYGLEVLNESQLRPRALVASAIQRLHLWYSQDACSGFDLLEFLQSGRVFAFETTTETVAEALVASEVDAVVPVRGCTYSLEGDEQPLKLRQIGPVRDERLMRTLLLAWRQQMVRDAVDSPWLRALLCLFELMWKRGEPNTLLDELRSHTAEFDSYDGEFCAHSCGELFARPLLDCAAILAHGDVTFEQEDPGVFRARSVPQLDERHFDEFVVPGLALLLLEHLESEHTLTRFESVKYSGDRCSVASFGCESLPASLFGRMPTWSRGARFVLNSTQRVDDLPRSFDEVRFVVVVERDLRLTLLARPV